jgi:outer membrane lipoprotein-sorting protein
MRVETALRRSMHALPLLAVLLAACSPPAPKASPVDEIVDAHLAARGGREKLKALRSIRETGTVTASDGRVAKVVREIKRPNLFRLEFSYEGTKSVFAYDGRSGWQVAPLFGRFDPEAMPPQSDAAAVDQGDIESPLVDWREKGHTVELVGREPLPGGDAFKLKEVLAGGRTRYEWIDAATHQIVRSDVERTVDGRQVRLVSDFSDFRDVGGILFPHAIETRVEGRPQTMRIMVKKVELDPELDDALFRMPG